MFDYEHSVVAVNGKATATGGSGQPKTTTLMGSKFKFHPAFVVSNIRNHIPTVLEMEKDQ
ncbi:hypothetical protein A2U01_0094801, partial [Trifolium medium]|nr:hypothetical protein [Trifolium medium]